MTSIDVPTEMAEAVRAAGGRCLNDDEASRESRQTADIFFFPAHGLVVELKCLTENLMTSDAFAARMSELYSSWIHRNLIERASGDYVVIDLKRLPRACRREVLSLLKRKLEPTLRKANRQIRESKQSLGAEAKFGLLMLVNEGNHAYTPEMLEYLLHKCAEDQLHSIDAVTYLSVNETVVSEEVPAPARFWFDWSLPRRQVIPQEIREELRASWLSHYSKISGTRVTEWKGRADGYNLQFVTR